MSGFSIHNDDLKSLFSNIDKKKTMDSKDSKASVVSTGNLTGNLTGNSPGTLPANISEKIGIANLCNENSDGKLIKKDDKFIKCTGCKSDNLCEIDGYNICQKCGLYNDCVIDSGQEWRYYGADDNNKGADPARADFPTNELLPHTSMGSLIGFGCKETNTTKRIRNMNFWNSIPYRESSLLETFSSISIMAHNAGISQCIVEEAKIMYKKVSDIKSSRRTKKEAMKAGCVMLACKLKGFPRSCNEIAKIFKIKNNKTLRKSIKTFEEIWNNIQMVENGPVIIKGKNKQKHINKQNVTRTTNTEDSSDSNDDSNDDSEQSNQSDDSEDVNKSDEVSVKSSAAANSISTEFQENVDSSDSDADNIEYPVAKTPTIPILISLKRDTHDTHGKSAPVYTFESIKYLHRFCSTLGLDEQVYHICYKVLVKVEQGKYLEKHNPLSRTASILYYVIEKLGINITKYNVVQTCEISEVTITKCYHKLVKYNEILSHYFA